MYTDVREEILLKSFAISLYRSFAGMEAISKRLILSGYISAFIIYLCGYFALLFCEDYISDFTTGLYWYTQAGKLAGDVLGVTTVPALLFEILYRITGLKNTD
jgi:hypothetical protein